MAGGRVVALAPPGDGTGWRLPPSAVAVPGFEDPHLHVLAMAAARLSIDAGPAVAPDLAGLARVLAAGADRQPGHGWLRAAGFDDALVAERRVPTRAELDAAVGDRPLVVHHAAGRVVLVNTEAGRRLGVGGDAAVLDARDPRLAGVPRLAPGDLATAVAAVSGDLLAAGVVAVTDATATNGRAEVELLDGLVAAGRLAPALTVLPAVAALGDLDGLGPGARLPGGARLGPAAKLVVEGDDPADLDDQVAGAHRAGWPVALHVTDVDGLHRALVALAAAPPAPAGADRLEHVSLCLPEQVALVAASGATVVTQPAFLTARGAKYERELGAVERAWLYRLGSLLAAGVPVAASSDAPVAPAAPLASMAAAIGHPERAEAVDAATALALVTRAAARASGTGGGVLRVGGPAAYVVLSGDPLTEPPGELRVLATVLGPAPGDQAPSSGPGSRPSSSRSAPL